MTTAPPPVRRREIFGWAMFDFANSSYTTVIVTVAFSVYFTSLVAPAGRAELLWGIGVLISNGLVVLLAPLVGAVADDSGRKKAFLFASYLACVAGTAALWLVVPGAVWLGILLFVVSNVAFAFGENFTAAFLPEISTPRTIGRISGLGWGLGYFGGLFSLLAIWPLLAGDFVAENLGNLRLAWVVTAGFFAVAGLPTFLLLRERAPRGPARGVGDYARVGYARLAETARSLGHFRDLARFLAVCFVFTCGLAAVINFSAIYAKDTLAFTGGEIVTLFLVVQLSSAAGALGFGWIQDRVGAMRTVRITLVLWVAVCVVAYLAVDKATFWGVALGAGLGIGSLQSASRALVGLFAPVEKSGEFFGFWGLSAKAAFAVGPFVFGALASLTGSQRLAILSTGLFFVGGLLATGAVDEARGRAAAAVWRERRGGGAGGEGAPGAAEPAA
ncbi:MAG TPA: MFS transporter [Thermoanaerobaculia bacterium]|nr:MFS transporter [Thermoanaerobaculia bacterium]